MPGSGPHRRSENPRTSGEFDQGLRIDPPGHPRRPAGLEESFGETGFTRFEQPAIENAPNLFFGAQA